MKTEERRRSRKKRRREFESPSGAHVRPSLRDGVRAPYRQPGLKRPG